MKHHLMQIAVLLVTFVVINGMPETQCPTPSIKPIEISQEYLIGNWRAAHCTDSPLCRMEMDCPVYTYFEREGDKNVVMHIHGYNETSAQAVNGEGMVEFTGKPGEYVVNNILGLKSANFFMLHAERHMCVLYGCLTDNQGVTTPATWISTKNDPDNTLSDMERYRALEVLAINHIPFGGFHSPTYNYCNKTES